MTAWRFKVLLAVFDNATHCASALGMRKLIVDGYWHYSRCFCVFWIIFDHFSHSSCFHDDDDAVPLCIQR